MKEIKKISLLFMVGTLVLVLNVQPVAAVDWWPMFRHDPNHTGYSSSIAPDTNNVLWTYGTYVESSPAVADGNVYFGSYDGYFYCVDAETGNYNWSYLPGHWKNFSSPAVADGKVYVGAYDHKVYCFRASDGHKEWEFTTGLYVHSSPALAYGNVYVSSIDGYVYCLPQNDPNGDGVIDSSEVIWTYGSGAWWLESSPAVADGRVYFGRKGTPGSGVVCLDAATGDFIWWFGTNDAVHSSPAVADGKVYVGSDDDNVYCLDASTGVKIWKFETDANVSSSPAVAYGKVYVGSWDHNLYCLRASDGHEEWRFETSSYVYSSPAVADGKVYVGSAGDFYCLDATSGAVIWSYKCIIGGWMSSPAVVSGIVYAGGPADGTFYAFGPPPYDVTIQAYCYTEGNPVSVSITMDGTPTGYNTSHIFTGLVGTHTPAVSNNDPSGHVFKQWDTGETSTSIIVPPGGTYTAYYQAEYTLSIATSPGGTTNPPPGIYTYWDGTAANVTAVPEACYEFDHWELDGNDVGSDNPHSVLMDDDHMLDAVFVQIEYDLTITATSGGTTDPAPGTHNYPCGSSVDVNAIPDEFYLFSHWELDGNDVGSANPYSALVDDDHTLHAVFLQTTYDLTITATSDGTTQPAPGTYAYAGGSSVEVNAIPDLNFAFDHWELDANDVGSTNLYSVLMDDDHLLHAVFSPDTDGDGVPDYLDNCPDINNPDQNDLDVDGIGDLCDNCPDHNNPDQNDLDGDGIGDLCECDAANIDGVDPVDFIDFAILANDWLLSGPALAGDINRDQSVDYFDVENLAEHWLETCACIDDDGDGYGDPANLRCSFPQLDCDDTDPNVNPGAEEICDDSIDNDCDGLTDYADPDCGPECWKCPTQCHGDTNCDGVVNVPDALILNLALGTIYPDPLYNPCADFDRDGDVDSDDFEILQYYYPGYPPADCEPGGTWPPQP